MKWVSCSRCALTDVYVRDDHDELSELAICDECWSALDALTLDEQCDDEERWTT
jgi:hypothetical protein